jgi:hypothetical protein
MANPDATDGLGHFRFFAAGDRNFQIAECRRNLLEGDKRVLQING